EPRRAHLRVVEVALDLAGGAGRRGEPAVAVEDRVPGVLPALVLEPGLVVPLVLEIAVAVAVAVPVQPPERRPGAPFELADELRIAAPALVLVEQDEVERRRVVGAV